MGNNYIKKGVKKWTSSRKDIRQSKSFVRIFKHSVGVCKYTWRERRAKRQRGNECMSPILLSRDAFISDVFLTFTTTTTTTSTAERGRGPSCSLYDDDIRGTAYHPSSWPFCRVQVLMRLSTSTSSLSLLLQRILVVKDSLQCAFEAGNEHSSSLLECRGGPENTLLSSILLSCRTQLLRQAHVNLILTLSLHLIDRPQNAPHSSMTMRTLIET